VLQPGFHVDDDVPTVVALVYQLTDKAADRGVGAA